MSDTTPRKLGIIEAFVAVRAQCPNGSVQRVARAGLDAVQKEGADALPLHAFYLLTAVRGWQGDRATQVKATLEEFLARQESGGS